MDKQYATTHNLSVDSNQFGKIMLQDLIDDVKRAENSHTIAITSMFLPSTVEALINEIIYLEKIIDGHNDTLNCDELQYF